MLTEQLGAIRTWDKDSTDWADREAGSRECNLASEGRWHWQRTASFCYYTRGKFQ